MKKVLLIFTLLLFTVRLFAQQFSQYNTGTLYDSFENPSQRAFIPDSSKQFASNFLLPNFNGNFFIKGDAQATLKTRAFQNRYDNSALVINQAKYNYGLGNLNIYLLMVKMYTSTAGDEEVGLSWQTKAEGRANIPDDVVAAFNGPSSFADNTLYINNFTGGYTHQMYHQISLTYHEKFNSHFSFGAKLSSLLGIEYQKLNIIGSQASFDNTTNTAMIALNGRFVSAYIPGKFNGRDFLPTFRNPGAAITTGMTYKSEDGFIIQTNIKDLGFIHWNSRSSIENFNGFTTVTGLDSKHREDSLYRKVRDVIRGHGIISAFNAPIDGRAEVSVNKSFWLDDDKEFRYSPTLVAQKSLFNQGFVGALVNPVSYKKYSLALTTSYNDLKVLQLGLQFMMQKANWDFFIGTDQLTTSPALVSAQLSKSTTTSYSNGSYSGGSFFLGFSLKFGPLIEHDMNSSSMHTGEKGFFGRLFGRFFPTND